MERQHTLQSAVSFSGKGLHTGETAQLEIMPAADNHGFQFQRSDLAIVVQELRVHGDAPGSILRFSNRATGGAEAFAHDPEGLPEQNHKQRAVEQREE